MNAPDIKIEPPGPNARKVVSEDRIYLATTTKVSQVVAEKAKGGVVTDVDGNTLLDFASGVGVMNIGHCHPKVVRAVKDQLERLAHFAGTDFYYDIQVRLAKKLVDSTPGDHKKKVFFSNSGTEAVEAALKVSRYSSGKKRFIAFIGAFHGRTMGSLSLTASRPVQQERFFPSMPGVDHIPYAYCYRCPYKMEPSSCGEWCAKILEEVYFETFIPPHDVAAVVLEPVQGEGGYIVPPMNFVREIARICKDNDILLVDDEIQAGMGRTGRMWAIENFGVTPDVICSAKSLGSGVPIAATIFRSELDFGGGAHSNTYGGNLLACASALATFDVIEEEGLLRKSITDGEHVHKRLLELQEGHEIIGDVRGVGMMNAIELVRDRETKEPAVDETRIAIEACFKKGLILLSAGRSTIRIIPPLTESRGFLDSGLDILDRALTEVERSLDMF